MSAPGIEGRDEGRDRLLICDCDGVLIDSEAVAAGVLVRELEARWPGVEVRPIVLPLLGLRTERVLAGAAAQAGHTLSAASLLAVAPILIVGWLSQKQLVRGLTFGAVK